MRAIVATILLLVPSIGFAQDQVWAVGETPSTRFADEDIAGPTFPADAQLTVLVREDDRLRVLSGSEIGWIAAGAVTEVAPVEVGDLPGLDALDLGSLQQMLDMPPMPSTPSKLPPPPAQ